MERELKAQPDLVDLINKIPERDKELLVLTPLFFWAKWQRRNILTENFNPVIPEFDANDPISIISAGFALQSQMNDDMDGDAVHAISVMMIDHPGRKELFPNLNDREIENICNSLENEFEEREYIARTEASSLYEDEFGQSHNPINFAIGTASHILFMPGDGRISILWFNKLSKSEYGESIIKALLQEKIRGNNLGLFLKEGKSSQLS